MRRLSIIATTLAVLLPGVAHAQAPTGALAISGSSTVRDWTCRETQFSAAHDSAGQAAPAAGSGVSLTFPVGAIDCGDAGMNDQLRQALKASRYPTITFGLPASEVARALAAGPVPVRVSGELTIAGETRPVQTDVTVRPAPGEGLQVQGEQSLRMTDFGVKPPVLMLGLLKVRDLVHVAFDVVVQAATLGHAGVHSGLGQTGR